MATEAVRIYPRGFIGHADVEIAKDTNNVSFFSQISGNTPTQNIAYNSEVTEVYEELMKTPFRINQFPIRERILKAALTCFGFSNFYDWILIQSKSNTLDVLSAEFIEDTVSFIFTGKRKLSIVTWERMIDPKQRHTSFQYNERFLREIRTHRTGTNDYNTERLNTVEAIRMWCSQPNGLEDMCATLFILFGRYN